MERLRGDLVGRAAELARLDGLLGDARNGTSGVLVLEGPAGIGKSALLDATVAEAADMTVVRALGIEAEASVPLSGLFDIVRPLTPVLDALPVAQAGTLRRVLDATEEPEHPPKDRFALGIALLTLLAAAGEQRPVLVAVDDVQWVDSASRDALLFAARRLESERVAIVLVLRGDVAAAELDMFPHLEIGPLASEEASSLLTRSAPGRIASPVIDRLLHLAEGNPLALVELPRALTPQQRAGTALLPEPMAVTARIEEAFTRQVSSLDEQTRTALCAAAASFDRRAGPIMAALDDLGLPPDSLDAAERSELIRFEAERIAFRHPLVRSAVYAASDEAQRRDVHRALAAAHEGLGELEQRARHLAAAVVGHDDEVADLLDEVASRAFERGALAAAAAAYERSAELTLDPDGRAMRLLRAAEAAVPSGEGARASRLLDAALTQADDLLVQAQVHHLRARLWLLGGTRVPESEAFLSSQAPAIAQRDPELAMVTRIDAAILALYGGDRRAAVETAQSAVAIAAGGDVRLRVWSSIALAIAHGVNGDLRAAQSLLSVADGLVEEHRASPVELLQLFTHVGLARGFAEDEVGARAAVEPLIAKARTGGAIGSLPLPLVIVANAAFLMGDWAAAEVATAEAAELAGLTGQATVGALAAMCQTLISAGRGRTDECRQVAAGALAMMDAVGYEAGKSTVHWGLGLLELGLGRSEAAIRSFREAGRFVQRGGNVASDGVVRWRADLVSALAAVDDKDEARRVLAGLEQDVARTGSAYARAAAARCRAILAAPADVDEAFSTALEQLEEKPNDFERGQALFWWGRRLTGDGRVEDARPRLLDALAAFESLEAASWVERVREVMATSGMPQPPHEPGVSELLNVRQLQVAVATVHGRTEAQTASELFITPGAVRRGLQQAYAALGVSTLDELRRRLDRGGLLEGPVHERDPHVSVSVLGRFDVRIGHQPVSGLTGVPSRALRIVAAHGGRIGAEELAELLWPEQPRARERLRNVLWRLSEMAGPLLVREGDVVRMADNVEIDVAAFEQEAEAAVAAHRTHDASAVGLAARAITRYVGDLLPDERSGTWVVSLRERLRRRYLSLLDILVASAVARNDRIEALSLLERAIDAEPYDEGRYVVAARLLLDDGRPAAALTLLQRASDVAAELGVPVSPEVRELIDAAQTT